MFTLIMTVDWIILKILFFVVAQLVEPLSVSICQNQEMESVESLCQILQSNNTDQSFLNNIKLPKFRQNVLVVTSDKQLPKISLDVQKISKVAHFNVLTYYTSKNSLASLKKVCYGKIMVLDYSLSTTWLQANRSSKADCFVENFAENSFIGDIMLACEQLIWVHNSYCTSHYPIVYKLNLDISSTSNSNSEPLKDKVLRITPSLTNMPFINLTNNGTSYSGMLFELIDKLANDNNLKYTIVPPVDDSYGAIENNSWNGLIGMVSRNETDIAIGPLTVTAERKTVVDFSAPFYFETIGILIRFQAPRGSMIGMVSLFTPTVWIMYLIAIFAAVITIYMLEKYTLRKGDSEVDTLRKTAFYVYSAQMNQKADRTVNACSGRLFEMFWRLSSFCVVSIYTGGFVADLTTNRIILPFNNLEQLSNTITNGAYKVCLMDGTAFTSAVMSNDSTTYEKLRKWFEAHPEYITVLENCEDRLLTETNVAFVSEMFILKQIQSTHCDKHVLIILNDNFFPGYFALALQKESPYKSILSSGIISNFENGLLQKWYTNYSIKPFCNIYNPNQVYNAGMEPLTVFQIGGALIVLAIGFVVGLCFFQVEMLLRYCIMCINRRSHTIHIWIDKV